MARLGMLPAAEPPSPVRARLTKWRGWLAFAGLVLFALTFTLEPFAGGSLMNLLHN